MPTCKLCKEKEALLNSLVCQECWNKSRYQAKASILLDGTESGHKWGVALLSPQILFTDTDLTKLDELEICGTWGYMDDGRLWLHLETPVQALQDKATLLMSEFSERRKQGLLIPPVQRSDAMRATFAKVYRAAPKKTILQKTTPQTPDPSIAEFNDLRSKIMKLGGR
ncbi:hypothetical protein MUP59_01775 [Candidatus Bathyarchaeota archaeon]|nr:hypothetical protein [Candidatus Bathyarchaeota archaeon]